MDNKTRILLEKAADLDERNKSSFIRAAIHDRAIYILEQKGVNWRAIK